MADDKKEEEVTEEKNSEVVEKAKKEAAAELKKELEPKKIDSNDLKHEI